MRKVMIAAILVSAAFATPAIARDGSAYVGLDAGIQIPSRSKLRLDNSRVSIDDAISLKHKLGYDFDAVLGYDFGLVRVEGEIGAKDAGFSSASIDPAAIAQYGPPLAYCCDANGSDRLLSGMVNALVDFDLGGASASLGGGVGEARERLRPELAPTSTLNFRSEDSGFAWQLLAEARIPISSNLDAGIKLRHFQAKMDFGPFCVTTCAPTYRLRGKYRSNSALLSLVYNFAGAAAPPPPPPPPTPPPPPPPPPATQTCPDGSVIPATDTCPAPPPPPPPPPPPEQRGERGQ